MSSGEVNKVSLQDLQLVQNLIERCVQLYMTRDEVVKTLQQQAKIEPSFTELVWQKLEEQNQEFYKAYHMRLILKDQIIRFNELLETQAKLMKKIPPPTASASVPTPNGSQLPLCYSEDKTRQVMKLENMHQSVVANPSGFINSGPLVHPGMQSGVGLMVHDSNMGLVQGRNGDETIKPEFCYAEEPSLMYNAPNNVVVRHPAGASAPIPSFVGEESNFKPVNEPIVDPDTSSSSFGFLGRIPRNFSLSDLTADFSISSDILDNYSRSPYLAAADTDILIPNVNGDIQGRHSGQVDRSFGK
ncbi:uncharacterized protein [Rutidosis leptorrhynchoides]|uniref:uncharacterized protein n=1 Tax=Rutidosis leptorrhynchoides TaxID=125765 RepID=UPI003A99317A